MYKLKIQFLPSTGELSPLIIRINVNIPNIIKLFTCVLNLFCAVILNTFLIILFYSIGKLQKTSLNLSQWIPLVRKYISKKIYQSKMNLKKVCILMLSLLLKWLSVAACYRRLQTCLQWSSNYLNSSQLDCQISRLWGNTNNNLKKSTYVNMIFFPGSENISFFKKENRKSAEM